MPFHQCDEGCVCPEHGIPMYYAPAIDDHACQDIECRYAHGFNEVRLEEIFDLLLSQSTPEEFDLAWSRRYRRRRKVETVKVNPALL